MILSKNQFSVDMERLKKMPQSMESSKKNFGIGIEYYNM